MTTARTRIRRPIPKTPTCTYPTKAFGEFMPCGLFAVDGPLGPRCRVHDYTSGVTEAIAAAARPVPQP